MYQQQKCYKTEHLSDSRLGMGVVIKWDKDWRGIGRPQVEAHRKRQVFLVFHVVII